jgi:predicted DNA-binding ribbon-helix-helix protein
MLRKRSVTISGHRTSISLEDEFWSELLLIAKHNGTSLNAMIATIDEDRETNLSSAIRLFVLAHLKAVASVVSA